MNLISRSFRLEKGPSLSNRLERSSSSLLASELVIRETSYEKLSQSMRFADEYELSSYDYGYDHEYELPSYEHGHSHGKGRRNRSSWSFLTKVFSCKKMGSSRGVKPPQVTMAVGEKNKRSTWLPDRQRRWPIQGWWSNSWSIIVDFCNSLITKY